MWHLHTMAAWKLVCCHFVDTMRDCDQYFLHLKVPLNVFHVISSV